MSYRKTNEAWFGDTFNRDPVYCYATADVAENSVNDTSYVIKGLNNNSATFTCNNVAVNDSLLNELTGRIAATDKISITATKDELEDSLSKISARIDALEQTILTKKSSSDLRSALKTLNYKREI